ncbi:MAG: flavodoxin family protein [Candidatus Micrarchaeia archaeon]
MKSLVVYISVHHGNTKRVAEAIASELGAKLVKADEVEPNSVLKYDLVGFGSGIYIFNYHRSILSLVEKLPKVKKRAFVFSTSGSGKPQGDLRRRLEEKGFEVVGEFHCKGWDTVGPLKFFGGINKGKPDENDLERAREFARSLKTKV